MCVCIERELIPAMRTFFAFPFLSLLSHEPVSHHHHQSLCLNKFHTFNQDRNQMAHLSPNSRLFFPFSISTPSLPVSPHHQSLLLDKCFPYLQLRNKMANIFNMIKNEIYR